MLANRINQVTIRNYRSLEDVTVDLDDLTVLVGPNGSGKSNFLYALRFLGDALRRGLTIARTDSIDRHGEIRSVSRSPYPEVEISLALEIGGHHASYSIRLGIAGTSVYALKGESCYWDGKCVFEIQDGKLIKSAPNGLSMESFSPPKDNLTLPLITNLPEVKPIYTFLTQLTVYSLFPRELRAMQKIGDFYPLHEFGENLASVLRKIVGEGEWSKELFQALAAIVPGIKPIRAVAIREFAGNLAVEIHHDNGAFLLNMESDGTIRVLSLLAALFQSPSLAFMGIEEPELFIHPGAFGVLADEIHAASYRGQIILTTHSPDLISRFPASSLRIVELVNGVSRIDPIRDDQLDIINQKLFSGGDLLRIEGLKRREQ